MKTNFPLSITIEPVKGCNLQCRHCFVWLKHKGPVKLMPFETFLKLEKTFKSTRTLGFGGRGEPFLNPNLIDMVKFAKSINPNIKIWSLTNATLLSEELSKKIVNSGLDDLRISIDGSTAKSYEKLRPGAQFKDAIFNIRRLTKIKALLKKNKPSLTLFFVATKENITELSHLLDLAKNLSIGAIYVIKLRAYYKKLEKEALVFKKIDRENSKIIHSSLSKAKKMNIKLYIEGLNIGQAWECEGTHSCNITWDGQIVPCCFLMSTIKYSLGGVKVFCKKYSFGKLSESAFGDIWGSNEYVKLRKMVATKNLPHICAPCMPFAIKKQGPCKN